MRSMKPRSPLRAGFDLARAGNFPSVASNVLTALVLAAPSGPAWPAATQAAIAILAGCLVYAGGATLNDVADAAFDAQRRPERAIPRGVVARGTAAWLGAIEVAAGIGILVWAGASLLLGLALVATILAYDWLHKRWSGSVVLMAGCRVFLALTLASLPGHAVGPAFGFWVAGLFSYIVVLSVLARAEYQPGAPAGRGRAIGKLLAFIPLLDATALLAVGALLPALACAAMIPLGRLAQRLAAST
jgi:4-hydroxybenzoate polyprenyltransferase